MILVKHRVKKCESCNEEMKQLTGCMDCQQEAIMKSKVKTVMEEFKKGELHSGRGGKVTSQKQAVAIALSQARKEVKKGKK